jgi:hypothetical protein
MTNDLLNLIDKKRGNESTQFADRGTVTATYTGPYVGYISNNKIVWRNVLYILESKEVFYP